MAVMEHRTSFALDETTIIKLRKLSRLWRVSQAEVVRRAIESAEAEALAETGVALSRLQSYHAEGGLAAETANAYLREVAAHRANWGRGE
ncbi:MAG: hypothetical protein JXM71_02815 [Spirochaetales bacterium]|nr:hypothetical protein [Spirochaetales bacterium]